MSIEKPQPLYNEKGQVNDPVIAEEMAEIEDRLRKEGKDRKEIDKTIDSVGVWEQSGKNVEYIEKAIPALIEKLKETLSEDEIELFLRNTQVFINGLKEK